MQRLVFTEKDSQEEYLPVHILLGADDYKRIRMQEAPVIGKHPESPLAEQTKLGWILYGGSIKENRSELCHFSMTGQGEFEKMCSINILGLKESVSDTEFNHQEYKENTQLPQKCG